MFLEEISVEKNRNGISTNWFKQQDVGKNINFEIKNTIYGIGYFFRIDFSELFWQRGIL
ncbi:MAG: hypothetical protein K2N80_07260 [Lachnospiraceae bacterium]|nr:hypothetical protein [Lachnospiraceae bacterium]